MTSSTRETPGRRAVVAGAIGNVLEWYDFAIYGFFAATIGRQFFPRESEVDSLIAAFGVFAAGYFMRPLGGVIFGHIGDRYGRKATLTLSTVAMALPTLAIGLLPTTAQIGTTAAVLLVVFRLLQGISIGGEYTGSVVYLVERAKHGRRGLFGTFSIVGAGVGALAGSATAALIDASLPSDAVESWGWRVPFLCGLVIGVIGLYLRRNLPETRDPSTSGKATKLPLLSAFQTEWRNVLRVAGLNVMHAVGVFMVFIYMKTYLHEQVGIPRAEALTINTISMLVLIGMTATFGALSDRVGRKPVLITSAVALIIFAYPLLTVLNVPTFGIILAGQLCFAVIIGAYAGTAPVTMTELIPSAVRVTGTSVGYNICMALFGGTTPMITVYLIKVTHTDLAPAYYLMAASAVSLAVVLTMKESAKRPLD